MKSPIRYARSGDVNIAFQVSGAGPLDLVLIPGYVSHLERDWEHPGSARFLDRLGSFARLIRFDKRGTGLSDRPGGLPDLETRMDDVRAVMDAVGSERAAVFGYSEGGPMAILFAATYPERTAALVLYGAYARRTCADDHPWAPSLEERLELARRREEEWTTGADIGVLGPNADPAMRRWYAERARDAASPGASRALTEMNATIDVRAALPAVRVPTLVLHRGGDEAVPVEFGRYLAARIPAARYVELRKTPDHVPWIDPDEIVDEVQEFLTGVRPAPEPERVLATILFTDIVGSTETAARLGDRRFGELLAGHHQAVRRELERFAGEEVDTAGDGFFALFDGPARAVRCALAIRDDVAGLGLQVRAGLHTGEVARAAGDVRGIAVHVAARVAAEAGAGEVLVTATTRDLVQGSTLAFEERGERALKGVDEPRRLYAAVAP